MAPAKPPSLFAANRLLILPSRPHTLQRCLSTTTPRQRNGTVPVFHETSHPELSTLLTTIRTKIFLPAHLKRPQLNLIYKQRNHEILRSDPFEVEIGPPGRAERFLLEPIDVTKDVPESWESVKKAIALMGESKKTRLQGEKVEGDSAPKNEFDNLIPLLTGMRIAGRKWRSQQWEQIARMAGENDAAYALVMAARQAQKTGLFLHNVRVVREIMWACREYAVKRDWSPGSCAKALGYVQELARLMEDKGQRKERARAWNAGELAGKVNVKAQADVIGVAVELAAKRLEALKKENADEVVLEEARDVLEQYTARLLPNRDTAVDEEQRFLQEGLPIGAVADYELLRWVPVLHGLVTASKSLGGEQLKKVQDLASQMSKRVSEVKSTVVETVGGDEGGKRRGFRWCNDTRVA